MNHQLVSVIIPMFNHTEPVVRAIQSVLAQSYSRYEIIVHDRGSTDGAAEAVVTLDGPISYVQHANCSLGAARNNAIRRSRGELIALLDPDDTWTPDKLEQCVGYLQPHPEADIVYSTTTTDRGDECVEGWLLDHLFESNCVHDSTAVFHRRVWERAGGFDESLPLHVGHNFWLRAAVGHRFGLIREPLLASMNESGTPSRSQLAYSYRMLVEMLFRFYEAQGGKERIDRFLALRTLGRFGYMAGKLALLEGDGTQAARALTGVLYCRPTLWTRIMCYAARLQRWWLRQPVYQELPLVYVTC